MIIAAAYALRVYVVPPLLYSSGGFGRRLLTKVVLVK
jgi:hypothetical protein